MSEVTAARRLLDEVAGAGNCTNPVLLTGSTVNSATGELAHSVLRVACKDRRAVVCASCSYLYKADAWILVSAGLVGGKGIDDGVVDHPKLFLTATAPSFGPVHRRTASGTCHPRAAVERCAHAIARRCLARHGLDDPRLGTPLCAECFRYEDAVVWNASASTLWHRTIIRLRQGVAASQHVSVRQLNTACRVHYLKVAELQHRGLVHFHAIFRADGPDGPGSEPPEWLTKELLATTLDGLLRSIAVQGHGEPVRWGTQFVLSEVRRDPEDPKKIAAYVAKYATKTTDGTDALARRFLWRRQIEHARITPHARRLALCAWDLADQPELEHLHLRHHAHAFGFSGQLITKSQGYSTTFQSLRAARAEHRAGTEDDRDEILGSFAFAGRGYSDPRGAGLAEFLHTESLVLRREARERRIEGVRESRNHSREDSRNHTRVQRDESADPR
jgi:hypothetical protein